MLVAASIIVLGAAFDEAELEFANEVHRRDFYKPHRHHHKPRHHHHRFLQRRSLPFLMQTTPEDLLKGRHPTVAKHLKGMDGEMQTLQSRHHIAVEARHILEGEVKQAAKHENELAAIKSDLAHTAVHMRVEERKLKRLEEDRLHLDRSHSSLVSSLRHVMGPKIAFAEARLQKRKQKLHRVQAEAAKWSSEETEFHAASLASIKRRDVSKEEVQAAAHAEEKAHSDWIAAEKELHAAKEDTNLNIERYRYSHEEALASASKKTQNEQETKEAESALQRLNHILRMEEDRVDESMALGIDRVRGKMQKVRKDEELSHKKFDALKAEYAQWQLSNKKWSDQLASTHDRAERADEYYSDTQKSILNAASNQAIMGAVSNTDWAWNDWNTA